MPDLIIHILIGLILVYFFKIKNWKLLITGSVLPDFSRAFMILLGFLDFSEVKRFLFLEPFHTPFISLLIIIGISLFFNNFFYNILSGFLGLMTHFFMDTLQFNGNFGSLLFYPFFIKEYTLNLFYERGIIIPLISLIITLVLIFFLKEHKLEISKRAYFCVIPVIIILLVVFSFRQELIDNNIHGINFALNPEKYENKEVDLYKSKVVSLDPVKINEFGKDFILETKEKLNYGNYVTVNGLYKGKKIYVETLFFHTNTKEIFSIIGLLIYFYLMIKK